MLWVKFATEIQLLGSERDWGIHSGSPGLGPAWFQCQLGGVQAMVPEISV